MILEIYPLNYIKYNLVNVKYLSDYDHISIELLAYRTFWTSGTINLKDHDDYKWVATDDLEGYDFAPADIPFVKKLRRGEIDIRA